MQRRGAAGVVGLDGCGDDELESQHHHLAHVLHQDVPRPVLVAEKLLLSVKQT